MLVLALPEGFRRGLGLESFIPFMHIVTRLYSSKIVPHRLEVTGNTVMWSRCKAKIHKGITSKLITFMAMDAGGMRVGFVN